MPISQNQALFSVIGNTYGGNSFVNFATPNLAGREATGAGAAPGLTPQSLGATAGSASTVLTVANLPPQPLTLANGTKAVVGGGQPINLMQPTLALQYIIAVQGVFPTGQSIVPDGSPFLGEISLFAGTVAPTGWDFADGQLLSIAANQALFAVIGTSYGGNGTFDFALPNLEDRIAVGTGDGVTLGEVFGSDSAVPELRAVAGGLSRRAARHSHRTRTAGNRHPAGGTCRPRVPAAERRRMRLRAVPADDLRLERGSALPGTMPAGEGGGNRCHFPA